MTGARIRRVAAVAATIVALLSFTIGEARAADVQVDTAAATLLVVEQAMIELTNADRVSSGLPPLSFDPELLWIARARAADQLPLDTLSHHDRDGKLVFVTLLERAGVRYALAGENLARSTTNGADIASRIETALMKSPTHRKNILERSFSRIAIGAALDSTGQIAFAQIFRGD